MKQGIHPEYHKITVQMTDGSKYETFSTWGKEGDVLQLDVDPKTHPAWIGGGSLRKTGQMEKFQNKFGDFSMKSKPASSAAPAPAAKKAEKPQAEKKAEKPAEKKEAVMEDKTEESQADQA